MDVRYPALAKRADQRAACGFLLAGLKSQPKWSGVMSAERKGMCCPPFWQWLLLPGLCLLIYSLFYW